MRESLPVVAIPRQGRLAQSRVSMWESTLVVEIPWGNLPLSIKLPQGELYLRKFVSGLQGPGSEILSEASLVMGTLPFWGPEGAAR